MSDDSRYGRPYEINFLEKCKLKREQESKPLCYGIPASRFTHYFGLITISVFAPDGRQYGHQSEIVSVERLDWDEGGIRSMVERVSRARLGDEYSSKVAVMGRRQYSHECQYFVDVLHGQKWHEDWARYGMVML